MRKYREIGIDIQIKIWLRLGRRGGLNERELLSYALIFNDLVGA